MVNALQEAHADKFAVDLRPRDEHKEELAGHGIESHGVVCVAADGSTLWKFPDHQMSQDDLDKGLATVLDKLN